MNIIRLALFAAAIGAVGPVTANTLSASPSEIFAQTATYSLSFNSDTFGADVNALGDSSLQAYWDNNQLVFPTVGFLSYEPTPSANGSLISFTTHNSRQTLNDLYFRDTGTFLVEPTAGYQVDSIEYKIDFSGGNNGLTSGIYLKGGANSSAVQSQWAAGSYVVNAQLGQLKQIETQTVQTQTTLLSLSQGEFSATTMLNDATIVELPNGTADSTPEIFGSSTISIIQQVYRESVTDTSSSFVGGVRSPFISKLVAEGNVSGIGSFSGQLGIESIRMQVNTSRISDPVISVPWPNMLWLWMIGLPLAGFLARAKSRAH
jgi:hypothetical protein